MMHSQNPFLYPGEGQAVRQVTGATGNVIADPVVTDIPNGGYGEGFAAHDCLEIMFKLYFTDGNATTDVDIEYSATSDFAQSNIYESVAVTGLRGFAWNAGAPISGYMRIRNNSGRILRAKVQKRIN